MRWPCVLAVLLIGPAGAATVAPTDVVLTIDGLCSAGGPPWAATAQGACKTLVTRAQFEQLTEALQPGMSPALRLRVAQTYAHIMLMAAAAERRGLDKTPAFSEEMRYARMQLLSQDLAGALRKDASNIDEIDVESYYKAHAASFETATLARVFVPHGFPELAESLRERAVAGEDPDKLQQEADRAAGLSRPGAPRTLMENVRRGNLPPSHELVMDLRAQEVSQVLADPGGGCFIYKMLAKEVPTLLAVSAEIRTQLAEQRYRRAMQPFEGRVELSDAYFDAR